MRRRPSIVARLAFAATLACALAAPSGAIAASTGGLQYGSATTAQQPSPGGVDPSQPLPALPPAAEPDPLPGEIALVGPDGQARAPLGAPPAVAAIIAAGNRIASTPYVWGGGHARWNDRGYDCSGSVSYVLHARGPARLPARLGRLPALGRGRSRTLDHDLLQHDAHVHGRRRACASTPPEPSARARAGRRRCAPRAGSRSAIRPVSDAPAPVVRTGRGAPPDALA